MKKAISIAIILLMLVSGFVVMVNESTGDENGAGMSFAPENPEPMLTSHAPIRINNNSDLASAASSGSGTEADPYIIENYDINGNGYGYCIYIGNTTAHFIVRNCYLHDANGVDSWPYYPDSGLILYNVQNGIIMDITSNSNNENGIHLYSYSNNNIIRNNTANSNKEYGIYLYSSSNNTISNNNASNNNYSIFLSSSSSNTISNNTANSNNDKGIYLSSSNRNAISNNTANSNGWYGIYLYSSNGNTITDNTANSNNGEGCGICLVSSSGSSVSNNNASNNGNGICLYSSSNNRIYHNNFINNTNQSYDDTGNNYWNASYPTGGNYWSDYNGTDEYSGPGQNLSGSDGIGDTPYTSIGGGKGAKDSYPLMNPFSSKLTTRTPIRINSNADFNLAHGVADGNGTKYNPYIIENYDINGTGDGYCIYIGNTTAHFIVRNCYLHDANGVDSWPYYPDSGLILYNVQNGTVMNITANSNNGDGIYLYSSNSNTLSNNTASNNWYGIHLYSSNNNTITNNTASNNWYGIYLYSSNSNTISNNTANSNNEDGIWLDSSNSNTLSNNTMVGDGIFILGNSLEHWNTHTIDTSNTVNGKPVYYWKNRTGGTVPSGAGEVILANCTNVVVENQNLSDGSVGVEMGFSNSNTLSNNTANSNKDTGIWLDSSNSNTLSNNTANSNGWYGIYLDSSNNTTISNNTASNNSNNGDGIWLYYSSNTTLYNNTVSNNWAGIWLYYSSNNTISTNKASNNDVGIMFNYSRSNNNIIYNNTVSNNDYGIYFNSSNNRIYHNIFINNTHQAYDDAGNNYWNASYPTGGNYWSDYNATDEYSGPNQDQPGSDGIGDTPYTNISGGSGAQDNYPLMYPTKTFLISHGPIRINNNSDFNIEHGVTGGNGTKDNPYIIENYDINGTGYGYCIYIGNTTDYFVVRNCSLHDASGNSGTYYWNSGLALYNAQNGTIFNNTGSNNHNGIYLFSSGNNTISNNMFSNNGYGIYLYESNNNMISNNTATLNTYYGINLGSCKNNTLFNNNASNDWYGIVVSSSTNNKIFNNSIYLNSQKGLSLGNSNNNVIYKNIISSDDTGIEFWQSNANTIYNNTISHNAWGFYLYVTMNGYSCSNNEISDNTLFNNGYGFRMSPASRNIIYNNILYNNNYGIYLDSSGSNTIDNNTASNNTYGIYLSSSTNNALYNNTMVGDGAIILGDSLNHWNTHTIDTSNTVNGKPVYYWKDRTGGTVPSGAGEVILANCTNVVVENQNLSDISVGIEMGFSDNNTISNNTASNNYRYGIYIRSSSNNTITNNRVSNNGKGLILSSSNYNRIYHNNFINNTNQSYDDTGNNYWNASYPTGGNYWSDYNGTDEYSGPNQNESGSDGIGDTPYTNIEGGSGAKDMYPLMSPVQAIELDLNEGWNLISIPWQKEPQDIESVVSGISWDRAMVYLNGTWYTYDRNRPSQFNIGFPKVDNTMGIWINCTSDGTLSGLDENIGNTSIPLHKGWNLVGFPTGHDQKVSDALSGIPWEYLETSDASGKLYYLSSSDYMIVGKGYWIYVTSDCVWSVGW